MRFILWIADHAFWISLLGAVCTCAVRFEKSLPRRVHRAFLSISLFITFATPLLGTLKKSLDDQWKREIQQQVAAALRATEPKPFEQRLRDFCDGVDRSILPTLLSGGTKFHGYLYQDQLAQLRELERDPKAKQYLKVEYDGVSEMLDRGIATGATFELSPSLMQPLRGLTSAANALRTSCRLLPTRRPTGAAVAPHGGRS